MKYVYLLESISHPDQKYIGLTNNFNIRFNEHNTGKSPYTSKYRPWKTVVVIRFNDDRKTEAFEEYLKAGSGHAFAKRHLW